MQITYHPYDPEWVKNIRNGGPDDYAMPAEKTISDGSGNPCRYCLDEVPKGAAMLICAARPFPDLQPYAETGPIFLCADDCTAYTVAAMPPVLANRGQCLLKAYGTDNRIIYGTGQITQTADIDSYCKTLFSDSQVAYIDARSVLNNCFTVRITRG